MRGSRKRGGGGEGEGRRRKLKRIYPPYVSPNLKPD
jgi:hypothetical protein